VNLPKNCYELKGVLSKRQYQMKILFTKFKYFSHQTSQGISAVNKKKVENKLKVKHFHNNNKNYIILLWNTSNKL
jgi:hypothetical protein